MVKGTALHNDQLVRQQILKAYKYNSMGLFDHMKILEMIISLRLKLLNIQNVVT